MRYCRDLRMKSVLKGFWLALAELSLVTAGYAQKQFNVLDWKAEYSLNTYLIQRMHQQYDVRRLDLQEAFRSRSATERYVQNCQSKALELLGSLPPRTPLHPAIVGTIQADGYSIQKIVYESFPQHHVTTNLYLPAGKGPFPAALLFCGHEDAAKATGSYQNTAALFAKNGFVVLAIDPISQGERRQCADISGVPLVRGGTTEHTLLNAISNLVGTSTVAYELWDNVRGLDYLVSRPEVDSSRIGCLGNSGGGMQTTYFVAYERRVKVAAVCSFLASRERNFELNIVSDGCSQMPGEGKMQLEMADYLIAAAPTPVLILSGRYDFIDYTGTVDAYIDVKNVYQVLGEPEKVSLFTYDDGHGISKPKREAAVTWFRRWLCHDSIHISEPALKTFSEKELSCTTTGQINSQFSDEITVEQRNAALFTSSQEERASFQRLNRKERLRRVVDLLSLNGWHHDITKADVGTVRMGGIEWRKIIVRKSGEIPLPLLEALPKENPRKTVVWFSERGKGTIADSVALMREYLHEGSAILLCDLRGMGETADKPELNDPKYYNKEYRNVLLAIHTGESLVGQRVKDVLTTLDYIASEQAISSLPIELNATGSAALPAIHALLFDTLVAHLNVYDGPKTFRTMLENPIERNAYSHVVPGILRWYDIPDLLKMVGTQRVTLKD